MGRGQRIFSLDPSRDHLRFHLCSLFRARRSGQRHGPPFSRVTPISSKPILNRGPSPPKVRWLLGLLVTSSLGSSNPGEAASAGAVNEAELYLTSQPPGSPKSYPARDMVDTGFLQLVRYGILSADDPLVVESLRAVDGILKMDTASGPCWHRYNHDGYGQKPGGGAYMPWDQAAVGHY